MKTENTEAMDEILTSAGICTDGLNVSQIAEDFICHMQAMSEMQSYSHYDKIETCDKCLKKDDEIKMLKEEIGIYNESVKRRRNAAYVYVDFSERAVKYDLY
jgi:hypothetical protein